MLPPAVTPCAIPRHRVTPAEADPFLDASAPSAAALYRRAYVARCDEIARLDALAAIGAVRAACEAPDID